MSEWKFWTPERDGHAPDDWEEGCETEYLSKFDRKWGKDSGSYWCIGYKYRYRPLQDATYEPDLLAQCLRLPQDQREALIEAMQKPTLLPCPFCGNNDKLRIYVPFAEDKETSVVTCDQCNAEGPYFGGSDSQSEDEAIAAWNRRAS